LVLCKPAKTLPGRSHTYRYFLAFEQKNLSIAGRLLFDAMKTSLQIFVQNSDPDG